MFNVKNFENVLKRLLPVVLAGAVGVGAGVACHTSNHHDTCAERVETYKELENNGINSLQYLGNYGEAKVALDSVKTYNFCKENGLNPISVADAHFLKDSLEMKQYGIEPYGRDADELEKATKQCDLSFAKVKEGCAELHQILNENLKEISSAQTTNTQ